MNTFTTNKRHSGRHRSSDWPQLWLIVSLVYISGKGCQADLRSVVSVSCHISHTAIRTLILHVDADSFESDGAFTDSTRDRLQDIGHGAFMHSDHMTGRIDEGQDVSSLDQSVDAGFLPNVISVSVWRLSSTLRSFLLLVSGPWWWASSLNVTHSVLIQQDGWTIHINTLHAAGVVCLNQFTADHAHAALLPPSESQQAALYFRGGLAPPRLQQVSVHFTSTCRTLSNPSCLVIGQYVTFKISRKWSKMCLRSHRQTRCCRVHPPVSADSFIFTL